MSVLGKIHPDVVEVTDVWEAAYILYSGASPVYKCTVNSGETKFTFLIPSEDFTILQEEFTSLETSLFVKPFVSAIKNIYSFQNEARRSSGEYISPAWREVVRARQETR